MEFIVFTQYFKNNTYTLLVLVAILLLNSGCSSRLPLLSNAGYLIESNEKPINSWKHLNEQNILLQRLDYSCGAASLATLMHYYFNDDVSEKKLLDYIEDTFTKNEFSNIEKDGLSFLELEKIVRSLGYQSANVRLELSALLEISGPIIVFLKTKEYRHFAVLRGVMEDRVFLADPSRGNIRLPIDKFSHEWSGEAFVLGKEGFGTPKQHSLAILHKSGFRNELELLRQPLLDQPNIRAPRIE